MIAGAFLGLAAGLALGFGAGLFVGLRAAARASCEMLVDAERAGRLRWIR